MKLALHYKKYKNKLYADPKTGKKKIYENKFKTISNNPKLILQLLNEITSAKMNNNRICLNKYSLQGSTSQNHLVSLL